MTDDDGRDIGRLIDTLVPPLPAVPDRVAAIRRRARRDRIRLAGLTAAATTLVLIGVAGAVTMAGGGSGDRSLPVASQSGPPGSGDCPRSLPRFPVDNGSLPASGPGVLAPRGAVTAIWCEFDGMLPSSGPNPRQLILTQDVAELVDALNTLPVEESIDPCFVFGGGGYLTLTYRDGDRVTIEFAMRCAFVRRGAITRHNGYDAVRTFDALYRQQELAAARPETVQPAGCPDRLTPNQHNSMFSPTAVSEMWIRPEPPRYIAGPVAVATVCRFERTGDGDYRRTGQATNRNLAAEIDDAVLEVYRTMPSKIPSIDCGRARINTIDVLVLRDSAGETAEIRVLRDGCDMVIFGDDGRAPQDDLLDLLDRLQ